MMDRSFGYIFLEIDYHEFFRVLTNFDLSIYLSFYQVNI
jgi:hypothetical protein